MKTTVLTLLFVFASNMALNCQSLSFTQGSTRSLALEEVFYDYKSSELTTASFYKQLVKDSNPQVEVIIDGKSSVINLEQNQLFSSNTKVFALEENIKKRYNILMWFLTLPY